MNSRAQELMYKMLEHGQPLLEKNDLDGFYKEAYRFGTNDVSPSLGFHTSDAIGLCTTFFENNGIKTLDYLSTIPPYYCCGTNVPESLLEYRTLRFPDKIKVISDHAFAESYGIYHIDLRKIKDVRTLAFASIDDPIKEVHIDYDNPVTLYPASFHQTEVMAVFFEGAAKKYDSEELWNILVSYTGSGLVNPSLKLFYNGEIFNISELTL